VPGLRSRVERAAALQRRAAAIVAAAGSVLDSYAPINAASEQYAEQHDLAARLRAEAADLVPGWLGAQLDALAPSTPVGAPVAPTFVRIGQAHPLDDARFPVVVPLLRAGHIAIDADARDQRVAGLLRSLLVRLLASAPPGSIVVRTVDAAGMDDTFDVFEGLPVPATDEAGLRASLDEAERWIESRPAPTMLLVIASLPELIDGTDLTRIAALAHAGPAGRLHMIVAGWPPPPLTAETTQAPLPHATQIALRNPYCWVGDPPGTTFAGNGVGPGRLNAPVYLDPDPPLELVHAVSRALMVSTPAPADPSPAAWMEYVAAAQQLDTVRRTATAVVAEQTKALQAARDKLSRVREKLGAQPTPPPPPRPAEQAEMLARLVNASPDQVTAALREASSALDAANAELSTVDEQQPVNVPRNVAVYTGFTLLITILQVPLWLAVSNAGGIAMVALPCGLLLPAFAFGLAWLTIGIIAPAERDRSTLFGVAISLVALLPVFAFVGWLGGLGG
jgi:hypothetical protein